MTIYLPKWLLAVFVGALLVSSTFVLGKDASGVTPWTNFGSGWARASGEFENPSVSLDGTTLSRPVAVRFEVKAFASGRRAYVSWYLTCWRGFNYGSRSGSQDNAALPQTRQFTLPIANPDYCSLDVSTFLTNNPASGGRVTVNLQARYP